MLNFSLRCRKAWWGVIGVSLGLMNAPAFSATYSTVFAFDLHTTAAGVVEGSGSNRGFLFGTTNDTNLTYGGSIFKVPMNGGQPQIIYQLKDSDGYAPQARLLLGTDGFLYGTTRYWPRVGAAVQVGSGTIFRVGQDGSGFTTLHTFGGVTGIHPVTGADLNNDGAFPDYALIQDATYLYGVTPLGGLYGSGTVFRVRKSDGVFNVLHHFAAIDNVTTGTNSSGEGATPSGSLLLASDGRLYGVTNYGGANSAVITGLPTAGAGTIYSLNVDGSGFETLYNFSALDDTATGVNGDGVQPIGSLLETSAGVLIGTASDGGTPADTTLAGFGTIFKFDVASRQLEVLYTFDNTTGAQPSGKLLLANGRVYGTTNTGSGTSDPITQAGVIYSIDPATADYSVVVPMTFAQGYGVADGLIQASDGDLYGAVTLGNACAGVNASGYGGVFRYSLTTNASSSGYSNCTTYESLIDDGGGAFSPGFLWLLAALGLAPPVRRRVFGLR